MSCYCCRAQHKSRNEEPASNPNILESMQELSMLTTSSATNASIHHCLCEHPQDQQVHSTNSQVIADNYYSNKSSTARHGANPCGFYILHMNSDYMTNFCSSIDENAVSNAFSGIRVTTDQDSSNKAMHKSLSESSRSNSSSKENDDRSFNSWEFSDDSMELTSPTKWTSASRSGRSRHRVRKPYEPSWRKKMGDRARTFSFTFNAEDDSSSRDSSSYNRSNPGSPEKSSLREASGQIRSKSLDNLPTAVLQEELETQGASPLHGELESMSQQLSDLTVN